MKKFLYTISLLVFFLPFLQVAKANEYKFFKSSKSTVPYTTPTIKFYGVSSSGEETLLNTWESSTSNVYYFDADLQDARVDQYKGKVYSEVNEYISDGNGGVSSTKTSVLEYDLVNNTVKKIDSISNIEEHVLFPKDLENLIREESDGTIHIGENSWITKEENGRQKVYAKNAAGNSIPIDYTNGTKLLINGRDVEQSINNVGALSAALTGLPTIPTETTLACGLGTGTHGGDVAFSGGCASKINEKLSINYAASMTIPGQEYAGDFEDQFSARAGFAWKLGKAIQPTQISMKEGKQLKEEMSALKEINQNIISQNKALLARLEKLEKIALSENNSKDLAIFKLK